MRRLAVVGFISALCLGAAGPSAAASASRLALPGSGDLERVSGGCGPNGFRDAYGYCRPRRIYAPGPPPRRRHYGCPYGFRPTPYGCRRY